MLADMLPLKTLFNRTRSSCFALAKLGLPLKALALYGMVPQTHKLCQLVRVFPAKKSWIE